MVIPEYKLRKILREGIETNPNKNRKRKFINLKLFINKDDIAYLEFNACTKPKDTEDICFSSRQAFPGTVEYKGVMPIECITCEDWINLCHRNKLPGAMNVKKLFVSIRSSVEQKLYKFPKQLDIQRSYASKVAAFFEEMEKLFSTELVINELEEDETSDFDEDQYNNNFMKDLKHKESHYALKNRAVKNNSRKNSPEFVNKYKNSYTNKKNRINPLHDIGRSNPTGSRKESNRMDHSPYTEAEKAKKYMKRPKNSKESPNITVIRKVSANNAVAQSRGSKIPTTATTSHTSSIPVLPPVVKDSWLKDRLGKQNLDNVKKRLQSNKSEFIEIYNDTDNENRSSGEALYYSRNNRQQNNSSAYVNYKAQRYQNNQRIAPKKKLRSANPNSLKIHQKLYTDEHNTSVELDQNQASEKRSGFFHRRRNKFANFQESKINDIIKKIRTKKQDIQNIENKYLQNTGTAYSKNDHYSTEKSTNLNPKKPWISPTTSKIHHRHHPQKAIIPPKVRNSPYCFKKSTPGPINPSQSNFATKPFPPPSKNFRFSSGKKPIKSKKMKKISSKRFLNSWENEDMLSEEDIKEEFAINENLEDDPSPREGSAAMRLIDSLSKFEEYENYDSIDEEPDDDSSRDLGKVEIIRKAQNSRLAFQNRPYSPPFSQFSNKS
ncbi:unnamed protein product [Moneuplotes crassus]|uniref:Uncharacterized protein n=1 Tax=Euplotes crassus TaxID=5936 RepID=A0AAD1Y6Z7_EUPCR|nr:unnamed protein product [Moneuplotes crassus]